MQIIFQCHFYALRKYQAAVFGIGHAIGTRCTTSATRLPGDMSLQSMHGILQTDTVSVGQKQQTMPTQYICTFQLYAKSLIYNGFSILAELRQKCDKSADFHMATTGPGGVGHPTPLRYCIHGLQQIRKMSC